MKKISDVEQELNKIRLEIYERIKDMSADEMTEYYRERGQEVAKQYGFRVVTSANE